MSTYQIAKKQLVTGGQDHDIVVQMSGDTLPGTYSAAASAAQLKDASDGVVDGSRVLFHVVQDALRAALPIGGTLDMSRVKINVVHPTAISVSPATVTKTAGATQQLTTSFTPTNSSNRGLLYSSSNPAKATVSATGLITAVASGTATITVTTVDGGLVGTCVVTIS